MEAPWQALAGLEGQYGLKESRLEAMGRAHLAPLAGEIENKRLHRHFPELESL